MTVSGRSCFCPMLYRTILVNQQSLLFLICEYRPNPRCVQACTHVHSVEDRTELGYRQAGHTWLFMWVRWIQTRVLILAQESTLTHGPISPSPQTNFWFWRIPHSVRWPNSNHFPWLSLSEQIEQLKPSAPQLFPWSLRSYSCLKLTMRPGWPLTQRSIYLCRDWRRALLCLAWDF